MKNCYILLSITIVYLLLTGCDKGFDEVNRNKNAPENAQVDNLFIKAQINTFSSNSSYFESYWLQPVIAQQASIRDVNGNLLQFNNLYIKNNWAWDDYYVGQLPNISDIERRLSSLDAATKAVSANKIAMIKILKAYCTHLVTDVYGAIPYSESAQGLTAVQNLTPAYDTQEQVYNAMLSDLKESVGLLTTDAKQDNYKYDIWFNGDVSKWKKFANALRLRLAMRISKVNEAKAKEVIADVLANPADLPTDNSDALYFQWQNYDSPSYGAHVSYGHVLGAARNMVMFMAGNNDPRTGIFFNKVFDPTSAELGNFLGVPVSPDAKIASGLFANVDKGKFAGQYSRMRDEVWENKKLPEAPLTPAEIYLLRAEIAYKKWSNEDAAQLYRKGVEASVKLYSKIYTDALKLEGGSVPPEFTVTDQQINDYLAMPDVAYSATNGLSRIQIQQWLNLHNNFRELYSNFRRTMVPDLSSMPAREPLFYQGEKISYSGMTRRYRYPSSEYSLNGVQVKKAVQLQGPDIETTRIWWDVTQ